MEMKKDSEITDFTDITKTVKSRRPAEEVFVFVVEHPPELAGQEFELTTPGILGRSSSATITIPEKSVSRKHLFFDPTSSGKGKNQIYVRDLNSTNGTFLNGQKITSAYIKPGDKISLGRVVIRFETRSPAEHRVRKMMKKEAELDPLTQLYNRKFFVSQIEKLISEKIPFSLIFIDLDNFKNVNDTYGHQEGDRILKNFATAIMQSIRETDIPARYGGDEIVVVLKKANYEIAKKILDRIRQKLVEISEKDGDKSSKDKNESVEKMKVDFSYGIAEFPAHGKTLKELIEYADAELYMNKRAKKEREKQK